MNIKVLAMVLIGGCLSGACASAPTPPLAAAVTPEPAATKAAVRAPAIAAERRQEKVKTKNTPFAATPKRCVSSNQVTVGMTAEQAQSTCWGMPKMSTITTSGGTYEFYSWHRGMDTATVFNGIVTSVSINR